MKQFIVFVAIGFLAMFASLEVVDSETPASEAYAQDVTGKPLSESLGWLLGEWEGEGVSRGDQTFTGKMSVTSQLDGTVIQINRESMSKTSNLVGGLKEISLIGVDGTTGKIVMTLYDNKNHIGLYVGELRSTEIIFSTAVSQPGFVDRRILKQTTEGIAFVKEEGAPGKSVSTSAEISFKKKI